MRIRSKRPKFGTRRVDLTPLKEALKDNRVYARLGLVTAEDAPSHFELDGEDLLVEVTLVPDDVRVTCRMATVGGGPGQGLWFVPPVGSEVAVLVPDGELESGPMIVGVLSTGSLPDGVAEGVTVIANSSKVLVHDGNGGAAPLPTLEEFRNHTHGTGVGPSTPTTDPIPGVGPITGTAVLEAK